MVKVGNLMKKSVRRICGACLLMICLVSLSGSERYSLITRMRADGWNLIGQNWSFWESGERQTGWLWLGKYWYYFDEKGKMATGKKWINDQSYYFHADGVMATGWQKVNRSWHYYASNGPAAVGWQELSGKWYYFNPDGRMTSGWKPLAEKWYYFKPDGVLAVGWQKIDNGWYYFNPDGAAATGWQVLAGAHYYFLANGEMATGWQKIENDWYYFSAAGLQAKGWQTIDGASYYFNGHGKMATGWKNVNGTKRYLTPNGKMAIGWENINGFWYRFDTNGTMLTGWQQDQGKNYYLNGEGQAATGFREMEGRKYYFDDSGARFSGTITFGERTYSFGTDGNLIAATGKNAKLSTVYHRGLSSQAPDSTLPAFELVPRGAYGIETDVRMTKDGYWVLSHDASVSSMTDNTGQIADYTLAQLKSMRITKGVNAGQYPNNTYCTLEEYLKVNHQKGTVPYIEIKPDPRLQAEQIRALLHVIEANGFLTTAHILSLDMNLLQLVRQASPSAKLDVLMPYWGDVFRETALTLGGEVWVSCNYQGLNPAAIRQIREAGLPLAVWTINSPFEAEYFVNRGLTNIVTANLRLF